MHRARVAGSGRAAPVLGPLVTAVLLVACGGAGSSTATSAGSGASTTLASLPPAAPGEGQSSRTATTSATPVATKVDPAAIRAAVAAVEGRLGGPQRYSEVNVTQIEANVFVVSDGRETVYVVHGSAVDPTSTAGDAYAGKTFGAGDIAFVPTVLNRVVQGLADSEVVAFSVTPRPTTGVDYIATVKAVSGEFRVLLAADGRIIQTD